MNRAQPLSLLLAVAVLVFTPHGACQTAPATPQHVRAEALSLEQQGDLSGAAAAWRTVLHLRPASAEAYAHLALIAARQEQYQDAIPLYRKALALDPALPGLRTDLGLAEFKSGDLKAAIQTFAFILKSAPAGSPEALRLTALIGMAHYGLGQHAAAIPYLKKAAAADPTNVGFRMALAQSCLAASQYPCVLDVYKELLHLNAGSAPAEMLVGEALDETQNHAGAIEHFRAAIADNPNEPNAHFGLGYLLWTQTRFQEAAAEFRAELANMPDHAQALAYLADCEIHLGKADDAIPLAEKAARLDHTIARAHIDLGILYAQKQRNDDAVREFKAAIRLTPNDQDPHWRLARLYQAMGKKEEAKAEFAKTRTLHQAEDESLVRKLQPPPANSSPAQAPAPAPPATVP